jgi:hypothetical protein
LWRITAWVTGSINSSASQQGQRTEINAGGVPTTGFGTKTR